MNKPTLNTTDLLLIFTVVLGAVAVHQKFVAPMIAPKTK